MEGIKCQRIGAKEYYVQQLFETEEPTCYLKTMTNAGKSVHEQISYQSDTGRTFAGQLEKNEVIKVYAQLPGWFKVSTAPGPCNPGWAVLVDKDRTGRLYFVIETKGSLFSGDLRIKENGMKRWVRVVTEFSRAFALCTAAVRGPEGDNTREHMRKAVENLLKLLQ